MAHDKKIIVGNWKMNLDVHEASLYLYQLSKLVKVHRDVEVVLAPTVLTLQSLSLQVNLRQFKLAAQNFYWRDHGFFTGEVSATQLRGIVQFGLVGHSERRHIFNETDKEVRNKVAAAIRNHIRPILCIGETAWERANNETHDVLHDQLIGGLSNITSEELDQVIIAYEPVWAIGDGQNANPDDVTKVVGMIRRQIEHLYGAAAAESIQILYGGSVTPDSAAAYFAIPGIDGLLIGGSSLDARAFNEIIEKAHKSSAETKKE
ncbi:triose-phosphate isomerase [Candidatus Saccharibacteria bacterium CG11_big_fil_rev_8_21_14_0_20_41_19]|nr:triose-phosphate isomerase [Candidatus Saccharibacteria bacterium]OIP85998.1 MAG: triose-phosphate isomerase [Candidatus Saccharibacteria bacterium CG2_30_41_52]PIQ70813.1 MAG: triose-phosphate isomerase [Candidatus Saccharibacteria bacterium CG11_big_fil_rev_8_21_14_0_20_41_19]PIZ60100.1 MAG: triose-phosphate isomerase [Candidatus Saccharibacteria bacterium CG_4_10_14_0_2_um_filter_41_11]PJC29547.1 MAG: triose-phosphate isomerase [Candidatus Saccharibacteria bacterium CG_4_9_14_0_2_um_filte